jgi:hypothetical protein
VHTIKTIMTSRLGSRIVVIKERVITRENRSNERRLKIVIKAKVRRANASVRKNAAVRVGSSTTANINVRNLRLPSDQTCARFSIRLNAAHHGATKSRNEMVIKIRQPDLNVRRTRESLVTLISPIRMRVTYCVPV